MMATARSIALALALVLCPRLALAVREEAGKEEAAELDAVREEAGEGEAAGLENECAASFQQLDVKGAREACNTCVAKPGCKWCALEQECHTAGQMISGGVSCMHIAGDADFGNLKIKNSLSCSRKPPWANVMEDIFGKWWETNTERVMDGIKCVQWSLGWPLTRDPSSESTPYDEEGLFGCMSVLLRNVMLDALGVRWDGRLVAGPSSFAEDEGMKQNASAGQPAWYQDRRHVEPKLCKLILMKYPAIQYPGQHMKCYTRTWTVDKFRELMKVWHNTGDLGAVQVRIARSITKGPLVSMVPGAGKSGSSFAATADGVFKVKMNLKYNNAVNEPENLMQLIMPPAQSQISMVEHFRKNPGSILNRFYGLFKLRIGPLTSYILLMGDAFYGMDDTVSKVKQAMHGNPFVTTRYDLKGLSRNQSERLYKGFSLINGDFIAEEGGKVDLQQHQCSRLYSVVKADAGFLTLHNMIDYSLLMLSVRKRVEDVSLFGDPHNALPDCPAEYQMPFCMKFGDHLYTFNLIDYLNTFSLIKGIESTLRGGKFDNYGDGIANYVKSICPPQLDTINEDEEME